MNDCENTEVWGAVNDCPLKVWRSEDLEAVFSDDPKVIRVWVDVDGPGVDVDDSNGREIMGAREELWVSDSTDEMEEVWFTSGSVEIDAWVEDDSDDAKDMPVVVITKLRVGLAVVGMLIVDTTLRLELVVGVVVVRALLIETD